MADGATNATHASTSQSKYVGDWVEYELKSLYSNSCNNAVPLGPVE